MDRETAYLILNQCGIPKGTNFFTLGQSQVSTLLTYADRYKYRAPKNANGSRGRYFHAYVERAASRED